MLVSVTEAPVVRRATSAPPACKGSLNTAAIATVSPGRYVPLGVDESNRTRPGAWVSIRKFFAAAREPAAPGDGSASTTAAPLDPRKPSAAARRESLAP